jgi:hypothetical protein
MAPRKPRMKTNTATDVRFVTATEVVSTLASLEFRKNIAEM